MEIPIIDGHFWILRDDKIIDWDFDEYKVTLSMWKCENKKKYIPAPEMTQRIMIAIFKKAFSSHFPTMTWEKTAENFYNMTESAGLLTPRYSRCFQNCLIEIHKNGGQLIFGSLGFKHENNEEYFYEFGGEDYKTIADFKMSN